MSDECHPTITTMAASAGISAIMSLTGAVKGSEHKAARKLDHSKYIYAEKELQNKIPLRSHGWPNQQKLPRRLNKVEWAADG